MLRPFLVAVGLLATPLVVMRIIREVKRTAATMKHNMQRAESLDVATRERVARAYEREDIHLWERPYMSSQGTLMRNWPVLYPTYLYHPCEPEIDDLRIPAPILEAILAEFGVPKHTANSRIFGSKRPS